MSPSLLGLGCRPRPLGVVFGLLALWLGAVVVSAVPGSLGDLDEDGQHTVLDLARLAAHLQGTQPLPSPLVFYADVNKDGVLNDEDQKALLQLVVESTTPEALPAATLRSTSPSDGEGDVALTRETILNFSLPLALASTLDTTKFWAEFGGRKVLSRVELSSDRKKATLFYLEPLPSNARLQVTFDPAGLKDILGRPMAASVAGAGGKYALTFDTLSITPVAATGIRGRVFASEKTAGGGELPLAGVTITVDGAEQDLRTTTDAAGNFTLSPCPAGAFFVHIDGRTAALSHYPTGDYYPVVGKKWHAIAGRTDTLAVEGGTIYLPCICAGTLRPVSPTQETVVTFPAQVLAQHPELAGVEIAVPANSLFADDGTRGGKVGLALVASDRLPEPLPPGINHVIDISIQSDGATNFDRPVPVCFPNLPDPATGQKLAPGAKSALWSYNHDAGEWQVIGPMTVTDDGLFVKTDAGVGVRQPGWHGTQPGAQLRGGEALEEKDPNCYPGAKTAKAAFTALADCASSLVPVNRWLKCGLSVAKAADKVVDYWSGKPPSTTLAEVKDYNSKLGLLSASLGVVKDCGTAAVSTVGPVDKILTCSGGAVDTLNTYLNKDIPPECSSAGLRNSVKTASSILGLVNAGRKLTSSVKKFDVTSPANILGTTKSAIDAARATVGAVVAAVEIAQPDNPNAVLTPAQKQAVIDAASTADDPAREAGQTGTDMDKLDRNLDDTQDGIRQGGQDASDALHEAGKPPTTPPSPPDIKITFPPDDPADPPVVIYPTPGSGGGVLVTGPPDRPYCMEVYNRTTGRYERICGITGPNGGSTAVPPIDAGAPPPSTPLPDADADGLPDVAEGIYGTNPNNPDTDGDGIKDGAEVAQGTNPLDGLIVSTGVIASAPVRGHAQDVCAVNNTAITANGTNGITVFNVLSGLNPLRLLELDTTGTALSVACFGDLIAVADYTAGLALVDISDVTKAQIVRQVGLGAPVTCVTTNGPVALAGTESGRVVAVDMRTGSVLWRLTLGTDSVQDVVVAGDVLYAARAGRLDAVSLATAVPVVSGSVALAGGSPGRRRISTGAGVLYVSNSGGWEVFDVAATPLQPTLAGQTATGQRFFNQIVPTGSGLAVAVASAAGAPDLDLYSVGANGRGNAFQTTFATPGSAEAVSVYNGLAYVADGDSGLQVVNYRAYDNKGIPPTITLASNFNLAAGTAEEGALMRLTATVADDVQVRNVEFYVDGALVLTDGNFPFEHRFVTPAIGPQKTSFTVRARATDTGGNATWTPLTTLTLVPDATPPQVLASQPTGGSLTGAVTQALVAFSELMNPATLAGGITLTAAGADRRLGTADDVLVAGSVSWLEETRAALLVLGAPLTPGSYRLSVKAPATDASGNAMTSPYLADFLVYSSDVDTDADGVPDEVERALGLNPNKPDSNNNGIADGLEDTDGDGLTNVDEMRLRLNPGLADTDGDGINDRLDDEDSDGILPLAELAAGTDPYRADSDGDGLDDGSEIAEGTDPLSPTPFTQRFYSGSVAYANAVPDADVSGPVQVTFFSVPAAYLNGAADGNSGGSVTVSWISLPVAYANETLLSGGQTAMVVSMPVAYANESLFSESQTATLLSAPVAYANEALFSEPQSAILLSAPVAYSNDGGAINNTQNASYLSLPVSYFNQRP